MEVFLSRPQRSCKVEETGRQTTTSFNIDSSRVKLKRSRQVPIKIFGTGHPQLDAECQTEGWVFPAAAAATASAILSIAEKVRHYPEPEDPEVRESPRFLVQAVTSQHLLLLSPEGHPETRALETSQGHLVVTFPSTLWAVCPFGVPLFVHLSTLLALFAAPACAFLRRFLGLFAIAVLPTALGGSSRAAGLSGDCSDVGIWLRSSFILLGVLSHLGAHGPTTYWAFFIRFLH